jgi:hypothetical protein
MTTIAVQDKYAEILTAFGDLQESVNIALQRYMIEQMTSKINELRQKNADYCQKYGLEYPVFIQRISEGRIPIFPAIMCILILNPDLEMSKRQF